MDAAAAVPLAKAEVQLRVKVVGIASSEAEAGRSCVTVETHGGIKQTFDGVIVTIPLGCLKRSKQIFHPPLTTGLTAAIDAISVGHLEKV